MDTFFERMRELLRISCIAALAATGVAGCSGSGGDSSPAPGQPAARPGTGTLLISLTDAEGDFLGYSVDVLSLTLPRRPGGRVDVLPPATRTDLAPPTERSD